MAIGYEFALSMDGSITYFLSFTKMFMPCVW